VTEVGLHFRVVVSGRNIPTTPTAHFWTVLSCLNVQLCVSEIRWWWFSWNTDFAA